jgi:hypothetical protein
MTFRLEVFQNEYLPEAACQVNAIITVTNDGPAGVGGDAVEIILLDTSGSMGDPPGKLREASLATRAAIECLRDGTYFAVVQGSNTARRLYPPAGHDGGGLAVADPVTKRDATASLSGLDASGGTAIGRWLLEARDLCALRPSAIHHALLLTDGKNESEEPADFEAAINACVGQFQCDCRGVGTEFAPAELRAVATALLGSVDIIVDPAGMAAEFRATIAESMRRDIGEVALRVWVPQAARVVFLKQVSQEIIDLTNLAAPVNALTADFPTGAWGADARDYHLCVDVPPQPVGAEMLAARVTLVVNGEAGDQGKVLALWTDDVARSTRINQHVAHYTGQEELAEAVQAGLDAYDAGDEVTATARIRRAVVLAQETGNTAMSDLLAKITEGDPATGTFRLKPRVDDGALVTLDTISTKTITVKRPQ